MNHSASPQAAGAVIPRADAGHSEPRGARLRAHRQHPKSSRCSVSNRQVPLTLQQPWAGRDRQQEPHGCSVGTRRDTGLLVPRAGPEASGGAHTATTNWASAKRDHYRAARTHWFSHLEITYWGRKQKIRYFKDSQCNNQVFTVSSTFHTWQCLQRSSPPAKTLTQATYFSSLLSSAMQLS